MVSTVRWGIAGTARIARSHFIPAVREAGGEVAAVAGRDPGRTAQWAQENGIERAAGGYAALIEDPGVDALYIPLPNHLHGEWTIRALRAGKPVLCEKPLTATLAETEQVLAVAAETGTPLWEAFVFPFHDQMSRLRGLIGDGAIGELQEIQSSFHTPARDAGDIRMDPSMGGGSLLDVGCYPVRLALELFGAEHESAWAQAQWHDGGVDLAMWGQLSFPGGRHLLFSCSFARAYDPYSRLLGTDGTINVDCAFHPSDGDQFEIRAPGRDVITQRATGPNTYSFTPAVRHIQDVVRGEEEPRLLAVDSSLRLARALHDLAESAMAATAAVPAPRQPGSMPDLRSVTD